MFQNVTTVALYDTLGPEATLSICNQCQLCSIAVSKDQISKLTLLKIEDSRRPREERKMRKFKNIIILEDVVLQKDRQIAADAGLNIYTFEEIVFRGR